MSEELYTTAFTSHDYEGGNDVERAEVFVVEGRGNVKEIKASGSGKSFQVMIDAGKEYEGRPLYSKGWAPADSDVVKKAQEALDNGKTVDFRIETVRNKGVDRSTPIAELKKGMENARKNVMHSVARIKFAEEPDDAWTDGIMRTNPLEDKKKTGKTALDLTAEELATNSQSNNGGNNYSNNNQGVEPPQYITRKFDGSINQGSLAVSVPLTLYNFVSSTINKDSDLNIDEKQRMVLTKGLLSTANKLQLAIFEGELETPDLGASSHTRARSLVFNAIELFFPITEEVVSSNDNVKEWLSKIYEKALGMWKWSIAEVDKISK